MSYQAEINDLIKQVIEDECKDKPDVLYILERAIEREIISQNRGRSPKDTAKKYMDILEKCTEGR